MEASRALEKANAIGRFPTPVSDVMTASNIEEIEAAGLSEIFLRKLRKKAGNALKRALGKIIGVFDAVARIALIDHSIPPARKAFVRLHETAHGALPWHRHLYAAVEEDEQTIAPEIAELFDREANAFASEVLFQLDAFSREADDHDFDILVPVRLSRRYGASIYASIRRYVSRNHRACVVLVLDPPVMRSVEGFRCNLRRVIYSTRFVELFGEIQWPGSFSPDDRIGAMVPVGNRKMSGKRTFDLGDRNDQRHECVAEAFTQGHQVFVLIHASSKLRPRIVSWSGEELIGDGAH